MKKLLTSKPALATLVGLLACHLLAAVAHAEGSTADAPLEPLSLSVTALSDVPFDRNDLTNRPVLIQFWASWCGSCGSVMWDMDKLLQQFSNTTYLAVSTDDQAEPAKKYARRHALYSARPTSFVHDTNGRMARQLGIKTVPTIVVVDPQGVIVHRHLGHLNSQDLQVIRTRLEAVQTAASVAGLQQSMEITDL